MKNNAARSGRLFLCISLFCVLALYGNIAHAQDMAENHNLDFGRFALRDNNSAHTIVIAPNGSVTYDPAIIVDPGHPAQRGDYSLTGLPPNMALNFGVGACVAPPGCTTLGNGVNLSENGLGAGKLFTISSYTANSPSTNGLGAATLYIGATLTTSGDGSLYDDGDYSGAVDITIYF